MLLLLRLFILNIFIQQIFIVEDTWKLIGSQVDDSLQSLRNIQIDYACLGEQDQFGLLHGTMIIADHL